MNHTATAFTAGSVPAPAPGLVPGATRMEKN